MSNTKQRIIVASIMFLGAILIGLAEYFGYHAVRYVGMLIVLAMMVEFISSLTIRHSGAGRPTDS